MTFSDEDLEQLKDDMNRLGDFNVGNYRLRPLLARLEAAERLRDYTEHENNCIRTFWEAGEPTIDGGYRTKFAGRWYQSRPVNEEPKCNCGLDEADEAWLKAAGK